MNIVKLNLSICLSIYLYYFMLFINNVDFLCKKKNIYYKMKWNIK